MLTEFYTRSGKTKLVQHPKHPFVYSYAKKQICIDHLNPPGMNKGSMRQHVEGKAHKRNYDTGESIMEQEIPKEILAELKLQKQESKPEPKQDNFDKLKKKFESIFPNNPEHVRELLVKHGFEWMIKYDIQNIIERDKNDKLADIGGKLMVALMRQDPEGFRKFVNSLRSSSIKKAESRHELPSKTPISVPKDSQNH